MSKIVKCIVCGKAFERKPNCRSIICSDECRKRRNAEYRQKMKDNGHDFSKYKKPKVTVVKEKKPDFLPTDEVRRLAKAAGLSYGYYVALKHMKGERI